jgi:hypothetical protein
MHHPAKRANSQRSPLSAAVTTTAQANLGYVIPITAVMPFEIKDSSSAEAATK